MIKAISTRENGRKILLLGLVTGNLKKLQEGQPIHINKEELWPNDLNADEIFIFWGETEESIYQEFKDKGYLKEAVIRDERTGRRIM